MKICKLVSASLLMAGLVNAAAAQNYSGGPVTIIVPYPAGGVTDMVARIVAQGLSKKFGQSFMVKNRSGTLA
jgi:tripartite-type tricarboxylate transporter receptor subunit TctC